MTTALSSRPDRSLRAARAAQSLFPPGAEVGGCLIGTAPPALPIEAAGVAVAVPKRVAEFAAGRAAVRRALAALGLPPMAVPMGANRAPIWPSGLLGSISHSDGVALAVLAPSAHCAGIGLDIEPDAPLPSEILPLIARPIEAAKIAADPDPDAMARLIFSAKEAAYKCQFPASQTLLGFDAFEIEVDPASQVLTARFCHDVPPFKQGEHLTGRYLRAEGLWLVGFTRILPTKAGVLG